MDLKEARESKLLTQEELATELKTNFATISRWERGKVIPSFKFQKRMNKFFGRKLEWKQNSEG